MLSPLDGTGCSARPIRPKPGRPSALPVTSPEVHQPIPTNAGDGDHSPKVSQLAGLGIGALASQLGSVTVSAVPADESDEVGGLQNTATNLGASLGTALAGSILIAMLTSSFLAGIAHNADVPAEVSNTASVELAAGIPFLSDAALESALADAGVSDEHRFENVSFPGVREVVRSCPSINATLRSFVKGCERRAETRERPAGPPPTQTTS